ncbi:hypothetical protein DN38_3026 [Vibrio cholerae]|nr:hypothetical protein DN38_3026 [Vibrio cholerae]
MRRIQGENRVPIAKYSALHQPQSWLTADG